MEEQQLPDSAQVASAIRAADNGDSRAAEQLFAALYGELHRMAERQLNRNAFGSTLGATTLLHEAYIDLAGRDAGFPDRARFFAYAARAMRGLIIDHVRKRRALKRGGEFHLTALNTQIEESVPELDETEMTSLDDALKELIRIATRYPTSQADQRLNEVCAQRPIFFCPIHSGPQREFTSHEYCSSLESTLKQRHGYVPTRMARPQ